MYPRPANWQDLHDEDERSVARLAEAGRQDLYDNGTRHANPDYALTEAAAKEYDAADIWGDACACGSNYSKRYGAWKCGECGQCHIGVNAATECCAQCDEDFDDDEDDDDA